MGLYLSLYHTSTIISIYKLRMQGTERFKKLGHCCKISKWTKPGWLAQEQRCEPLCVPARNCPCEHRLRIHTVAPPYLQFCFAQFLLSAVSCGPNVEYCRNKQITWFKLCTFQLVWWNLTLSCFILPGPWIISLSSISMLYIKYDKIFWERDYHHITFITLYCYNYYILLLVLIS